MCRHSMSEAEGDFLAQFLAWDTFARRRVDMIGRVDHGDEVIAHEFDYSVEKQVSHQPFYPQPLSALVFCCMTE